MDMRIGDKEIVSTFPGELQDSIIRVCPYREHASRSARLSREKIILQ